MEHTLEKEKMDAVKAIADANLKISEARNTIFKLEETETEYLVAREKKALDRIQVVVEESQEVLETAKRNFDEVKALGNSVSEFSRSLLLLLEGFKGLVDGFEERNVLWEQQIGKQQDDLVELKKGLKSESVRIENDKKSLEQGRNVLREEETRIRVKWGEIDRAIIRLKEGRI